MDAKPARIPSGILFDMEDEDIIIIHCGRVLTDAEYNNVQQSIVAFLNARWPNMANIGIDC